MASTRSSELFGPTDSCATFARSRFPSLNKESSKASSALRWTLRSRNCGRRNCDASGHTSRKRKSLTHIGSWASNFHTGRSYHRSDEVYRLHGFEPTQGHLEIATFWKTIHPEDEPAVRAVMTDVIHARTDYDIPEFRICLPDGKPSDFCAP